MALRYRSVYNAQLDSMTWDIQNYPELFYRPNFKCKFTGDVDIKIGDYIVMDENNWFRVTEVKDNTFNRLLPHIVSLGEKDGDRPFSHYAHDDEY